MPAPTPEQLRAVLHKIDTTLGDVLTRDKIDVTELTACRAVAARLQTDPTKPLTPEQVEYLEKAYPRLEKLAQLGNDYMQRLRQMPQHKQAIILTFPNKQGNGLVSHIKYSYVTVPTTWYDLLRNPFGYSSVEFRHASEAAAKALGLKCESNFWGTKVKIRNADGSALTTAQANEYYQTLGREMDKRGLPTVVGKYEQPAVTPGLAPSASASPGLSASPSAAVGLSAGTSGAASPSPGAPASVGLSAGASATAASAGVPTAPPAPTLAGNPTLPAGTIPLSSPAASAALFPPPRAPGSPASVASTTASNPPSSPGPSI